MQTELISNLPGSRVAIVVPMYNEISGAETCVRQLLATLPTLPISAALIFVDDGSVDGTGVLLDGLSKQLGGIIVIHKTNGGYGSALVAGAKAALDRGYNYVLFMDSDLTNPPEHIVRFVPPILNGFDLIKGSRFSGGGSMASIPWRRRIFSVVGNLIARMFFRMGAPDCTNGFRAIRTDLFLRMPLQERSFAVIVEELYWAKKCGLRVTSVPTTLTARTNEQRATTFVYRPHVIWTYLRYTLRAGITFKPSPTHSSQ